MSTLWTPTASWRVWGFPGSAIRLGGWGSTFQSVSRPSCTVHGMRRRSRRGPLRGLPHLLLVVGMLLMTRTEQGTAVLIALASLPHLLRARRYLDKVMEVLGY